MFQFPGFAFITLCIQVINTWFTLLLAALAGNNNKVSGGLPHSEIHGSKLILSSPWLIAEYHVFHRLLLPRHPPNALFALDLIQKKRGFFNGQALLCKPDLRSKCIHCSACRWFATHTVRTALLLLRLVYLTWNKIDLLVEPADLPSRGQSSILMLYLSIRCQMIRRSSRPVGRQSSNAA